MNYLSRFSSFWFGLTIQFGFYNSPIRIATLFIYFLNKIATLFINHQGSHIS